MSGGVRLGQVAYDKMIRMTTERTTLQILSLNLEHGLLLDDLLRYIRDKSQDVSVFCFQESYEIRDVLEETLRGTFSGYHVSKPTTDEVFRVSTYVRKEITVEAKDALFETDPDMGVALRCTMRMADGTRFAVTNVYGVPQPGHKLDTPERLLLTRELIAQGRESDSPRVLIGDFNLLPEAQSIREFVGQGYRDLIDEFRIPTTRNERAWKRYPDNPQLFADYAFVRGESMAYDLAVDDVTVSDHLPLRLEVTFK